MSKKSRNKIKRRRKRSMMMRRRRMRGRIVLDDGEDNLILTPAPDVKPLECWPTI